MFSDEYEIVKEIKKGNQIRTCIARDKSGQLVVVKELSLKKVDDWKTLQLFEREAELYSSLSHPRIPVYRDLVQEESEDNCFYYLVYEYTEGKSLQELLDEGEIFPYPRVRDIMLQILNILEYLHGLSTPVIHRDINPKNIILRDDQVYLVDFGAGKKFASEQNKGDTYVGTYGYMPFEQMVGDASPKSDLYALAMTAIHLLTGRHPSLFDMEKMKPVYIRKSKMQQLDYVIDRMIEPDPADRAESAVLCSSWIKNNTHPGGPGKRTASGALESGRVKTWRNGDVAFLVCRKNRDYSSEIGEGLLRFWRDHPFISVIALSVLTGGPLFLPLMIIRMSKTHKRWLSRKLCGSEEVSIIADARAVQVPGQISPVSRKRLVMAEVHRHRNSNNTVNLEVDLVSRGGSSDTFYIQGLTGEEAGQVTGFLDELIET